MGNQLAQPQKVQPDHLAEIPNVVLKEHLGGGRFLKTVLCVHDEGGQVVVKVYNKRGDVDLNKYAQQLAHIRTRLSGLPCSHVWPFQHFFHTDKAAYLIRQHIFSNLYHRLSTRPFLAGIEKHWIAFQLLHAVTQSHEQGICHGDIKCENVLVTSWHWTFLADFASYKPTYLPADNPADFSFFFDTGGRRRCYIAPERFYSSDSDNAAALADAPLQPSMDIFSLGCVIAELFLEGRQLFDLSELLAYKRGDFSPEQTLTKVEEPFKQLILHMISLDPDSRLSAAGYLQQRGSSLFPHYFENLLHPFFCSLLPMDADSRIAAVQNDFPVLIQRILGPTVAAQLQQPLQPAAFRTSDVSNNEEHSSLTKEEQAEVELRDPPPGKEQVHRLAAEATGLLVALQSGKRPSKAGNWLAVDKTQTAAASTSDASPRVGGQRSVVVEEALEYQCRDRGRAFGEASTSGRLAALKAWTPPKSQRKEDIALPTEPGWQWADEWRVDRESPTDGAGWSYRLQSGSNEATWSPKCKLDCLWRRRRWTRQRRKLQLSSQATSQEHSPADSESGNAQGMIIVATLLCSTMRGAHLQVSKTQAITLLTETAKYCNDDTRLQRIVPYLMESMKAPIASVRHSALAGLVTVLGLIESLPPSDAKVFAEYILPSLSLVPNDKEEWMRVAYAAAIGPLAASAHRFFNTWQASAANSQEQVRHESDLQDLRVAVERMVHEVVVGAKSTANTRRALLSHLAMLASFLGRRESNDFLLPVVITFLNSPDWQLRSTFFTRIGSLGQYAGPAGIETFLLPCLSQALADRQDAVVAEAIHFLAQITEAGYLRRRSMLAAATKMLPGLLHHSCASVRANAADFAAAAARRLSAADSFAFLRPLLAPALVGDPPSYQDASDIVSFLPKRTAGPKIPAVQPKSKVAADDRDNSNAKQDSRHVLFVPQSAPLYSVKLTQQPQGSGQSVLSAALASNLAADKQGEANGVQQQGGAGMLLARARRMTKAATDMASAHGRLAPSLQLGSDEALSFQVDALRTTPPPSVSAAVNSAMDIAIHSDLPTHTPAAANNSVPWRPRGLLVTHLAEHKKAVNRIAIAGNGAFFATASSDETVKIWDCRRLEKDVTFRSRLTYASQGGRILACTACEDSQSMATGSSNGSLHIWRVEYTTRPGGNPDRYTSIINKHLINPDEGAVLEITCWDALLLYSTQRGKLHALDMRTNKEVWSLPVDPSQGCWETLAVDRKNGNWLVAGSSRGRVTLCDMRFQLCVKSWQHPAKLPIQALTPALANPRRLGLPRVGATCPLLYIAAGPTDIGLWDIENARCCQVLRTQPEDSQDLLPAPSSHPSQGKARGDSFAAKELQQLASSSSKGHRALLPTAAGPLLTGSSDGCIRCWDAAHIDQSYMVCGSPQALDRPGNGQQGCRTGVTFGQKLAANGMHVVEELPIFSNSEDPRAQERRASVSHCDGILHLSALQSFGERILISAGADGVVKTWR